MTDVNDAAEPITILLDLHVSIDDVPIGLSLQRYGPFKFSCNRLWIKPITDVDLPLSAVGSVLDTNVRYSHRSSLLFIDLIRAVAMISKTWLNRGKRPSASLDA